MIKHVACYGPCCIVGHRDSGSNLRSPTPNWYRPLVPLFPVVILGGQQNALQKSRPVNINFSHWIWIAIEYICRLIMR